MAPLIRAANLAQIAVVVVTNQSGVGRGYLTWEDFAAVQCKIGEVLQKQDAYWDMVLACPFHADGRAPYNINNHPGRKPNTGMIDIARRALDVNLERSWIIGDKASDIECGKRAGLQGGIYAGTHEKSCRDEADIALSLAAPGFPVRAISTITEAASYLPYLTT